MLIEQNKVVTFHYRVREPGHEVIEDSHDDNDPAVYLHGHQGMVSGLEAALAGKKVGDMFSVTLSPEQAYGHRRSDALQRISVKHINGGKKAQYKPGMVVQVNTSEGLREVVVVKAGLKTVDVDTNHPLAGKTLEFDIEVIDVRDASAEEIAHGHVHGAGGHHH